MNLIRRSLLCGCMLLLSPWSIAADFPQSTVKILVPFPPGGSMDALARIMSGKLAEKWGQSTIVENRPGAASVIGTQLMATATPDGSTIGVVANGFTINPGLYKKLPYDTIKDFEPVVRLTFTPNVLVAHPKVQAANLKELLALAKSAPGTLTSGSIGNGTAAHLTLERLKAAAGVDITHVPFQGLAPGVAAVLGGHTDLMMANLPDVLPHIRTGKLKAMAVASAVRNPLIPDVSTFLEAGLDGFVSGAWYGLVVPAATPKETVARIRADASEVVRQPDVTKRLADMGLDLVAPENFKEFMLKEIELNTKIVRSARITVD